MRVFQFIAVIWLALACALAPAHAQMPGGSAPGSDAALVWRDIQNTKSLKVLDDFIRQFGDVPIYGPLARERREELAKTAVVITPTPQLGHDSPLTAQQERRLKPKDTFRECEGCPEMVVLPAGSFTMGALEAMDRYDGPQHVVTISRPFAVSKLHVTVDQFRAFVSETLYEASTKCHKKRFGGNNGSWRNPGFAQEGPHPVVCVSWEDAKAYVDWMTKKTGKAYRLLSDAEWEYAARGQTLPGAYPDFWFGDDITVLCRYGNFSDQKAGDKIALCNDGYAYTSPAGHYQPNAFGLYDMAGNAWQWTADCYHDGYNGAPADGSAWTTGACSSKNGHVVRGGSWDDYASTLRASRRIEEIEENNLIGFRAARTLISAESSR
jgi:formylglycine-generating enzyme required for sulfatase activity